MVRLRSGPTSGSRVASGTYGKPSCPPPAKPSSRALHALLQTQAAPVLRGEILPERVPSAGLLILRDGDPGEPAVDAVAAPLPLPAPPPDGLGTGATGPAQADGEPRHRRRCRVRHRLRHRLGLRRRRNNVMNMPTVTLRQRRHAIRHAAGQTHRAPARARGAVTMPSTANNDMPAVLLNHAGLHRGDRRQEAAANDATFALRPASAPGADGLLGSDDFSFKVSPDGST